MRRYLLITLSLLLLLPNFLDINILTIPCYNKVEQLNPSLSYINTINKLEANIDSAAKAKCIKTGSLEYIEILSSVVSNKFYHGFSSFSLSENWIAALAGKFIWGDLACKVNPNEIIKHSYAGCSQQAIVMMAILRKKNISYRSVGFPHHYALEVLIDNKWYFFDVNMEPKIAGEQRSESNWRGCIDSLKKYYNKKLYKNLDEGFGINLKVKYGIINKVPAPNQRIFELVTKILSRTLWCLPLFILFYLERRKKDYKA